MAEQEQKAVPRTPPPPRHLPDKIEWDALEHEDRDHSSDWFLILWIIAVTVAIGALLLNNFLFAAFAIVSAFVMSLHASRPPHREHFTVSHRGIAIGKTLYPYSTLNGFALKEDEEEHDGRYLLLRSRRSFAPLVVIPIAEDIDTKVLRDYIIEEIPERDLHLPFAERIMELVGF